MEANLRRAGVPSSMVRLDVVLPAQHFGSRRMQGPEERLMIAVLQDALDCIQKHRFAKDPHRRRLFKEATQWFLAVETDWPYSFECICGALALDANAVRQRLRVAPEQQAVAASREWPFCTPETGAPGNAEPGPRPRGA